MSTNSRLRASLLAGLVVATVFAVTAALGGTAVASHDQTTRGGETWSPDSTSASGSVGPGAVVFQGEEGIDGIEAGNGSAADFAHVDTGAVLAVPVPQSQQTGTYSAASNDDELVVRSPRITDHAILGPEGSDVAGGSVTSGETVEATARYNFGTASDLTVVVHDETGMDITSEAIPSTSDRIVGTTEPDQAVTVPIDTSALEAGTYTITITGLSSDLRHGDATVQHTLTVEDDSPRIEDYRFEDESRADVAGGSVDRGETVTIVATHNVDEEATFALAVSDESGVEITDEVVAPSDQVDVTSSSDEPVDLTIDTSTFEPGTYEILVAAQEPGFLYDPLTIEERLTVEGDPDRITDYRFENENGADVAGGTVPGTGDPIEVRATYNFGDDSDLTVVVHDESGVDVTATATPNAADRVAGTTDPEQYVTFPIERSNLALGTYTVTITATDPDLRDGDATVQDTVTIGHVPDPELVLQKNSATRGERVRYDVNGGLEGDHYLVTVRRSDGADGTATADVFRNVGDTRAVGTTATYAYAIVEVDGGIATGSIDSDHLAATDVTVQLRGIAGPGTIASDDDVTGRDLLDEKTLSVTGDDSQQETETPTATDTPPADRPPSDGPPADRPPEVSAPGGQADPGSGIGGLVRLVVDSLFGLPLAG